MTGDDLCISSSTEAAETQTTRGSHSRTWLERPLVSDDRTQLERHLASEQLKRHQLEETLNLLLHQQQQQQPSSMVSDERTGTG